VKIGNSGFLGERIKSIRREMGLNQAVFAKKLGLGGSTVISKYEKNQREPEIAILIRISELGNKNLNWLLTGKSSKDQKRGDKKLEKLISQIERLYREGDPKKISAIQVLLDLAAPPKPLKKKN